MKLVEEIARRKVVIADYDPQWPMLYEKEKVRIQKVIGRIAVAIEHIGSTAVRGLGAKSTTDIMVAVNRLSHAEKCIGPLQSIGYEYVPEYEARAIGTQTPPTVTGPKRRNN